MLKRLFLNDSFILALILINALIIFIGGFDLGPEGNLPLALIDSIITILFIVEMVVKIREYGNGYFHSNWNRFDFLLVLFSIPALVDFFFHLHLQNFSFVLVFRVMRVFKSLRFLKFIPGIDHLIRGIKRALKSSVIVMAGFAVYIFIVGIFSFYIFKDSCPAHFGNPLISLYSTFKIFTIEGWFEIPEQVTAHFSQGVSFLTHVYFIFVVLSGGILGLSLVNSIFVDAMVSDNNDELTHRIESLESKIDRLLERND